MEVMRARRAPVRGKGRASSSLEGHSSHVLYGSLISIGCMPRVSGSRLSCTPSEQTMTISPEVVRRRYGHKAGRRTTEAGLKISAEIAQIGRPSAQVRPETAARIAGVTCILAIAKRHVHNLPRLARPIQCEAIDKRGAERRKERTSGRPCSHPPRRARVPTPRP